jgi:hypothetical protein
MSPHSRGAFHPSFASFITLIRDKGAGKPGWPLHPGPPRKEICASAREPQVEAVTTGLPCAMVYDLLRALPGEPAFATVIGAKPLKLRANLAPAWARQDHTTSPSARQPLACRDSPRPPHSVPTRTPLVPVRNERS